MARMLVEKNKACNENHAKNYIRILVDGIDIDTEKH